MTSARTNPSHLCGTPSPLSPRVSPNLGCCILRSRRLKKLSQLYSVKAGEEWDAKLKEWSEPLKKWIPNGITVNERLDAHGLLDTINSSLAHGIPLPPQLMDQKLRKDLEAASVAQWFGGYLGISPTSPASLRLYSKSYPNIWGQRTRRIAV